MLKDMRYAPRPPVAHKLDPYKAIVDARLEAFPNGGKDGVPSPAL